MSTQETLYRKLKAMEIGPKDATLDFRARLARENGWSRRYAERVIDEYKRFVFLAATGAPGEQVTPSDEIDQAWHLHLTYTRNYWDVMCDKILKAPLHHGPTAGGKQERQRYHNQYQATLDRYRQVFDAPAPSDIWPPLKTRFAGNWRRIDKAKHFVIPHNRAALAAILPSIGLLAACTPTELSLGAAAIIAGGLGLLGFGAYALLGNNSGDEKEKRDGGGSVGNETSFDADGDSADGGGDGGSGCGGGCGGCGG